MRKNKIKIHTLHNPELTEEIVPFRSADPDLINSAVSSLGKVGIPTYVPTNPLSRNYYYSSVPDSSVSSAPQNRTGFAILTNKVSLSGVVDPIRLSAYGINSILEDGTRYFELPVGFIGWDFVKLVGPEYLTFLANNPSGCLHNIKMITENQNLKRFNAGELRPYAQTNLVRPFEGHYYAIPFFPVAVLNDPSFKLKNWNFKSN